MSRAVVFLLATALISTSIPVLRGESVAVAAAGDPFRFIYDQAGRLVAAVTPTDSAKYTYDAVGNTTAITRSAATTLSLIEFAPHSGTVGSTVTIYGTAFSTTPSSNTVKFNGVLATVTSATTTQLVATVPAGATTGTISVKVGNTTVTSSAAFTVTPSLAPTISTFTARGAPGDTITISGSNYNTNVLFDRVTIGGTFARVTAATSTTLTVIVPPIVQSGAIVVATPDGVVTAATDFYSPPTGFATTDIGPTGRISFGQASTFNWTVGGSVGLFLIDGTVGHRMSLNLTGNSMTQGYYVWIRSPDGTALVGSSCCNTPWIDAVAFPMDGTYEVVVDAAGTGTGGLTLTPYDVPADAAGTLVAGGSAVTLSTTVPGQNIVFTFTGTVNERVSLALSYTGIPNGYYLSIKNPDGSTWYAPSCCFISWVDTSTLTQSGTYTILIDPVVANTGSATATLYEVPADATSPLVAGGSAVTLSTTVPGQNIVFTFTGAVNERVSFSLSFTGMPNGYYFSIKNPDGSTWYAPSCCFISWVDTSTLTQSGTYTILVDPVVATMGSATGTLYEVPADATSPLVAGGSPVTLSTTVPGQNIVFTFSGTVNERVSFSLSFTGMPNGYYFSIKNPDGSTWYAPSCCFISWVDATTLTQSGTYTILVDPVVATMGSATGTLYEVPADAAGTLVIDGSALTLTVGTPGQNAVFSFEGTTGDHLTFNLTAAYPHGWNLTIRNPDASILWGPTCCNNSSAVVTLTQSGTHTVLIDPITTDTGDATGSLVRNAGLAPSVPAVFAKASPPGTEAGRRAPGLSSVRANSANRGVLVGQVFGVDGHALEAVTVRIDDVSASTDGLGRFTLLDLPSGHQELWVDGSGLRAGDFGVYEIGVEIAEAGITQLPFTVYLAKIDDAHAITIPSPTTEEVILTSPRIPGLEVHLAPGTVITDDDGNVLHHVSLTELSRSRPPFPLPSLVETPVYFTVQPGGAYLSQKARVYYPNTYGRPPGTRAQFWHYDPDAQGWYVYGEGQVSSDGQHVVPDPGVGVYELTGAMIHFPNLPLPDLWAAIGDFFSGGDPVDLGTGLFVLDKTDLAVSDILPLSVTRTYRSQDTTSRYFGIGATNSMELFLRLVTAWQEIDLILPDGGRVRYLRTSPGNDQTGMFEHTLTPTRFYKSTLHWNGASWDLVLKDGTKFNFNSDNTLGFVSDRFGNRVTFQRNGAGISNRMDIVRSPNGRWLQFSYDGSDRISSVTDNIGRTVNYTYDASGRLWKVTDPAGKITEYGYDTAHRLTTIKDPRLITFLTNEYDPTSGRVTKQTQADTGFFLFAYTVVNGKVTQTDVTDPRGHVRRATFNTSGYGVTDTFPYGLPEAQQVSYDRDLATGLVNSVTDALGRITVNTYYPTGDLATTKSNFGTQYEALTSFTYDPVFNEVLTVTDPLAHATTFHYDARGNRDSESDALGHASTFGYNNAGELTRSTNALNKDTIFGYQAGDLVSVTDPLSRITKRFSDAAGRPVYVTDALGSRTRTDYDVLNRVTQVTDPLGNATIFTYDDNGNRLTLKDARNNVTTYTYDSMDRVATRKDALLRIESYSYDPNGNLLTVTDRKNQVTEFRYDNLDRQTFAGFGRTGTAPNFTYTSTIDYGPYDNGNRLTRVVDHPTPTTNLSIDRGYFPTDLLQQETTADGSVSYDYDLAGRRISLTVSGQSNVFYCYDNADRLLTIRSTSCAGTTLVTFSYDNADRRTTLDLPNATHLVYGYDDASQLRTMTWSRGGPPIGDLAYEYDAVGRRTTMSGSYARLNLPAAVSTALYNANNQLTKWGNTNLSYDNNGNMLGDGTNTYTWNARDQLQAVTKSGQTLPSFTYDALGRRLTKTLGATTTTYRYDGANAVQEKNGTTVSASLLTGLGVDEVFQRTEGATARTFMSDALGSTLALADSAGVNQTSYTYAPYGATTSTGATSANTSQFTGRDNDADGLYYYRARYYHPIFGRFVSEDPIGFASGNPNLYAYVHDTPTNFTDPEGEFVPWLAACASGAAFGAVANLIANSLAGRKNGIRNTLSAGIEGCVGSLVGFGVVALVGKAVRPALVAIARARSQYGLTRPELREVISGWDRATAPNRAASIRYHYGEHGEGQGLLEYTRDAIALLRSGAPKVQIINGYAGGLLLKLKSATQFGIYTFEGKIVSYGPK